MSLPVDPNNFYIVCHTDRFGYSAFSAAIEFRHFPPSNKMLSDQFSVKTVIWKGQIWNVLVTPLTFAKMATQLAHEFGLKIADGLPTQYDLGEKN